MRRPCDRNTSVSTGLCSRDQRCHSRRTTPLRLSFGNFFVLIPHGRATAQELANKVIYSSQRLASAPIENLWTASCESA